ncbi:MAG: cyclic nucleotide-binding domain-containing protein [Candidatus Viridilinea halotolerans]|uniref:Cyclic nucleotide-binding domain-containing protein n=1 Tax=Candidatus Viridilinea halotolerans TaxID=2491704 RepID=A0A426U3N2_9CHLR|nr:MAG: cyclic nucleotide-binding domain-containing protein [Candidatus Viridilinea halotolerans]
MPTRSAQFNATIMPGGLWGDLSKAAALATPPVGIYAALNDRLAAPAPTESSEIYGNVKQRTDVAQYRPCRAEGVDAEELHEDGHDYTILSTAAGRYLRLSPVEAELWRAMDGSRTVAELGMLAFTRFRQLVLVADLVEGLRQGGFLADAPVGVYRALCTHQDEQGIKGWSRRVWRNLQTRKVQLDGVDAVAAQIYRWGGWSLFTLPFLGLMALLVGMGAGFFSLVASGQWHAYSLIDTGNLGPSLFALWVALLCSFALHELAHAVAVKHFGRRVLSGGVMLYYAMPAAYVDTSDIWRAGRRPRIIVSLAGPLCDLLVGSVAAILAVVLPMGWAGEAAYRLAAACYIAAICNLNPLLELDGYYMLSDWLRLPNLRARALGFIAGPLWQKLQTRAPFGREERIFTLYGSLAALYTTLAIVLAVVFWQNQLLRMLGDLWLNGGQVGRLLAMLIMLVAVLPIIVGLLVAAWGVVVIAAGWIARRGYARSPFVVATAMVLLACALAVLPLRLGVTPETQLIGPLLWMVALIAQLALRADYHGAAVARALDAFLAVTSIELVAQLGLLLLPDAFVVWISVQSFGFTLLLLAGFVALLDYDLHQASWAELLISALLLGLAFLAGGGAIWIIQQAHPTWPFGGVVLLATPVYASMVALALLLPLVVSLHDSRQRWSWFLLWTGMVMQAGAYLLELHTSSRIMPASLAAVVLASGLWAAAWLAHIVALRQPTALILNWPVEGGRSEGERLQRAFQHTYAGLYRMLHSYSGARRARALDDRMDILAATANWELTLDRDRARIGAELAARPLDAQGLRFAEVLRYSVTEIERLAGATFARRAIQAAYDALPWPEREAADRRCFPHTPWARELSQAFGDARAARLRLLREIERFALCDDETLAALASAFEPQRMHAGANLPAASGLWIVEAGEVLIKAGERIVGEVQRGACLDLSIRQDASEEARSYQTSINSTLLFLPAREAQRLLVHSGADAVEEQNLAALVRDLERAPFFHELPRALLRTLALQAKRLTLAPHTPIVRQGLPGGRLYVMVRGEAAVVCQEPATATTAAHARLVARLGPPELFGEIELLRGTLPIASVVSIGQCEVIALPHHAVAPFLANGQLGMRNLERIGTGRLWELKGVMATGQVG